MPLTFGKFKEIVAPYAGVAGKCASSEAAADFARWVMEYLLYEGSTSAIRKLSIYAYNGKLVFPPEVEVPLKVKINGQVTEVWNKWCTISNSLSEFDGDNCYSAREVLAETGEFSPLAYPLPPEGSLIGVKATCEESAEARATIAGVDPTGREIYSVNDKGERVVGEEFKLVKDQIRYSKVRFGRVTSGIKPITNGYVQVFAVFPEINDSRFLVDWRPSDEVPLYRTWNIIGRRCAPIVHVSIQFRARLKDNYQDNELTLFENYSAILLAAQRVQAERTNNIETANYKRQATQEMLENESDYKKKGNGPIFVFQPLSGSTVKNIVGNRIGNRFR